MIVLVGYYLSFVLKLIVLTVNRLEIGTSCVVPCNIRRSFYLVFRLPESRSPLASIMMMMCKESFPDPVLKYHLHGDRGEERFFPSPYRLTSGVGKFSAGTWRLR